MAIGFSIIFLILITLFYLSNPKNRINQWCAISGVFFWAGITKEVVMNYLIPMLNNAFSTTGLEQRFALAHSLCTWMIYTLAMPAMLLAGAYFSGIDTKKPSLMRWLKRMLFLPGLVLSFIYYPQNFRLYQLTSLSFWITYTTLNFVMGAALAVIIVWGMRTAEAGKPKNQKKRVAAVMLPPLYYWLITVFIPNLLRIEGLFTLWETNVFLLLICIIIFIYMAFKDGFMGLKLFRLSYDWNTDMSIINTNAEFTSHMLKSQTNKMELCIDHLKAQYSLDDSNEEIPEELAILSRSIATQKELVDKLLNHSQTIYLKVDTHRLSDLIMDALLVTMTEKSGISVSTGIEDSVFWICDRTHMLEVFDNILTNAVEAMQGNGTIEISGKINRFGYCLQIKDSGAGMDANVLKNIFMPHFTTKNTEKNFGLGLVYCRNVLLAHHGNISAKSQVGKGTAIIIDFPSNRVRIGDTKKESRDVL